ncbi:MAG: CpsD/CapB family tyrosine-protein kinase, partial [Myxococcota bacterium]
MGEITEALRRAKDQRESRREPGARTGDEVVADSTAARAGIDGPTPGPSPAARPAPEPVRRETGDAPAAISRERDETWPARAVLLDPRQPHTERFRRFALRVRHAFQRMDTHSLLVTSSLRSEGKTFTSCNLALAFASMAAAERIALLELDTRRPSVARSLGVAPRAGVEEVLAGSASLDDVRVRTELPSLDLFLVREPPERAHELLALPSLADLLRELGRRYDAVIVDSPPLLLVPDVPLIVEHVGACIAV